MIITDREQVLASSGIALQGHPLPEPARQALERRELVVMQDFPGEVDVPVHQEDNAAIAAPLMWDDEAVGVLILVVPMGPNLILDADIRTADGLAQLFSSQLELGEFHHQIELRRQAEFRALQSQINPHFLYNALNTISALWPHRLRTGTRDHSDFGQLFAPNSIYQRALCYFSPGDVQCG